MNSPIQAWSITAEDFPQDGYASDQMAYLLGYAILAPSNRNSQPWLFRINAMDVDVYCDPRRLLGVSDPEGREMVMSCGAALYNLRVAAEYFEKAWRVELVPDSAQAHLLARFHVGLHSETSSDDVMLFHALTERRNHRGEFLPGAVPGETLEGLAAAVVREGAWFKYWTEPEPHAAMAEWVAEADRCLWSDPSYRREVSQWSRVAGDGHLDGLTSDLPGMRDWLSFAAPSIIRHFDLGKGRAAQDAREVAAAPVVAVLGTQGDATTDWLVAGQALESVLLHACAEGLKVSCLAQPLEVPFLREQVAGFCSGASPQMLLRLGFGGESPRTPRRAVRDVLLRQRERAG